MDEHQFAICMKLVEVTCTDNTETVWTFLKVLTNLLLETLDCTEKNIILWKCY